MNKYLSGALAGLVATAPMTIVMFLLHKQLPRHEQHPLPPENITQSLVSRAGMKNRLSPLQQQVTTWTGHFGFGMASALVYGSLAQKIPAPPPLKGALFGLLVWAFSYLGWLPALKILNQPQEQGARPNGLMIVAHLVWGAGLGLLTQRSATE